MEKDQTPENPEFAVLMLTEDGKGRARCIQKIFDDCLNNLTLHCGEGREFALTKTKLEEACFFAKKAMAKLPQNHQT